jgi:hypothetical protein
MVNDTSRRIRPFHAAPSLEMGRQLTRTIDENRNSKRQLPQAGEVLRSGPQIRVRLTLDSWYVVLGRQ